MCKVCKNKEFGEGLVATRCIICHKTIYTNHVPGELYCTECSEELNVCKQCGTKNNKEEVEGENKTMNNEVLNNEELLLEDAVKREELIERVDVLEKVKNLFLMPRLDFTTAQGVANFYEVDVEVTRKVINAHKEELLSDGMIQLNAKDVMERLGKSGVNVETSENADSERLGNSGVNVERYNTHVEVRLEDDTKLKIANRRTWIFPRRAILRVGMLLRDSKVAKEVRTQLLNIEETVAPEVKVKEIDNELDLLGKALATAYMDGDVEEVLRAATALNKHNNKYKDEARQALKEENIKLRESIATLEEDIQGLTESLDAVVLENQAMSKELTYLPDTIQYRDAVVTIMNRVKTAKGYSTAQLCYQELYKILKSNHAIDLLGRKAKYIKENPDKNKTGVDCLKTEEEWKIILQVSVAMAYRYNADVYDIVKSLENSPIAQ